MKLASEEITWLVGSRSALKVALGNSELGIESDNDESVVMKDDDGQYKVLATQKVEDGLGVNVFGNTTFETVDGIDINPGSDVDADLISVGVGSVPSMKWDNANGAFSLVNANFIIPAGRSLDIVDITQGQIPWHQDGASGFVGADNLIWNSGSARLELTNPAGQQLQLMYDGTHYASFTGEADGDLFVNLVNGCGAGEMGIGISPAVGTPNSLHVAAIVRADSGFSDGATPGIDFNGVVTNITVSGGIITAAS